MEEDHQHTHGAIKDQEQDINTTSYVITKSLFERDPESQGKICINVKATTEANNYLLTQIILPKDLEY